MAIALHDRARILAGAGALPIAATVRWIGAPAGGEKAVPGAWNEGGTSCRRNGTGPGLRSRRGLARKLH
jgi:hypothetical protein